MENGEAENKKPVISGNIIDRRKIDRRKKNEIAENKDKRSETRRQKKERRTPRVEKVLPVKVSIDEPNSKGKNLTMLSRNIGKTGIFIEAEKKDVESVPALKSTGYQVKVEIQLPEGNIKIKRVAEIVRVSTSGADGKFGISLKFVEISKDKKIELGTSLKELVTTDQEIIDIQPIGYLGRDRFTFNKTLYLTDTNALGNAYFARYFDWQGMAREEFLKRLIPDPLAFFRSGFKILTTQAYMEYKHETSFYDEIEIEVKTAKVKKLSLDLIFIFRSKKTERIVARGYQKLAFVDHLGNFTQIPAAMRNNMLKYQVEMSNKDKSLSHYR